MMRRIPLLWFAFHTIWLMSATYAIVKAFMPTDG